MKVLVCGAAPRRRTGDPGWTNREAIHRELEKLPADTVIIEGEAEGADLLARDVAEVMGFTVEPYPAEWKRYGRAAGPIRNRQMLDEGQPDLVLAFHADIAASTGTADMLGQAKKRGIPTRLLVK